MQTIRPRTGFRRRAIAPTSIAPALDLSGAGTRPHVATTDLPQDFGWSDKG